nr:MAG TPA: hypothetical protein [Caudoviricetes sp.]
MSGVCRTGAQRLQCALKKLARKQSDVARCCL